MLHQPHHQKGWGVVVLCTPNPAFCSAVWGTNDVLDFSLTACNFANWDPVSSQSSVSESKLKSPSSFSLSPPYDALRIPMAFLSGVSPVPCSEGLKTGDRTSSRGMANADQSKDHFIHLANHAAPHTAIWLLQAKLFSGGFIFM